MVMHAPHRAAPFVAVLLLASCDRGSAPAQARQASVAQCTGTDTHTKHLKQFACETCHPRGGEFGFSGTLPGGQPVTGTMTRDATGTPSCAVTCHDPDGATAAPIAWNAGPLTCVSCHQGKALVAGGSAHAQNADRATCEGCHDLAQHMGGAVRLVNGMQPGTEAMCLGCHSGSGGTLANAPGPLLVGWQDPAGDWHGARAGTGSGGSLKPPFARTQASLPCASCHDEHASTNAFLFASVVNGAVIPAAAVDRAGVGAETVCASCHEGERHAWCLSCHLGDPMPAGSPCFFCHGHEGLVNFPYPSNYNHAYAPEPGDQCDHCHSMWRPTAESVPPVVVNGVVNVRDVGLDSATITWATGERATGFVEWGAGTLGRVDGDAALADVHTVRLTGLAPATTYSFRVRSADAFRNVTRSAVQTFRTASPGGPLAPELVDEPSYAGCEYSLAVTLEWLPVVDPDGDPVQYRIVVDDSPAFDSPSVATSWGAATSYTTTFALSLSVKTYFWRVQARDATHDIASPWSAIDQFSLSRLRDSLCQ